MPTDPIIAKYCWHATTPEIALMFVRLDNVADVIVNANHGKD